MKWHGHTKKLPKFERYALAERIFTALLNILIGISRAEYLPAIRKRAALEDLKPDIGTTKILVRLSRDFGLIDEKIYLNYEQELHEIGNMTGGWIRTLP